MVLTKGDWTTDPDPSREPEAGCPRPAPVLLDRIEGKPPDVRGKKVALIGNQVDTLIRFRGPLIRAMVARGHTVYALVPGFTDAGVREVRRLGAVPVEIRLHRTSLSSWRCVSEALSLQSTLRRLQPDVVLTYFLRPIVVGSLAARMARIRNRFCLIEGAGYIYTEQETQILSRRLLRALVTRLFRMVLAGSDRIFVLNTDDEALVTGAGFSPAERITRLPGIGIDLDFYRPVPQERSPVTFLLAARLIPEKGIRDYVAAAQKVKAQCPGTRFLLLGGADEHPRHIREAEIRAWVDDGLIEWPGHVDDVRPYMAAASVYVLPSFYREGLPRSLLEAMAMARAIVTTDTAGCREAVIEGGNGFLVPRRDPDALAEALMRFVREPDLITSMGEASRRFAEARFDVRGVNATLLEAMGLDAETSRDAPSDETLLHALRRFRVRRPPLKRLPARK